MSELQRGIAGPFIVAPPVGARVGTRLRLSAQDVEVLRAVGSHLGSLAERDLAARCREGRVDAVVAVDVNAGHLAAAVLAPDGNMLGSPYTVSLELAGLPSTTRDGRLRAAASALIAAAQHHCDHAIVIENLDFAEARSEGRERNWNCPVRGRRGRKFRHVVVGIPTSRFRDRLVQMTHSAGFYVIAVDPAYTSRWGAQHWLHHLQEQHPELTVTTRQQW